MIAGTASDRRRGDSNGELTHGSTFGRGGAEPSGMRRAFFTASAICAVRSRSSHPQVPAALSRIAAAPARCHCASTRHVESSL